MLPPRTFCCVIHALLQNWPWGAHSRTGRLELTACLHNMTCIVAGHVFHKKPSKQADMHTQRIHNMGESEWGKCPIVCTRYTVVVDLEEVESYTFKSCQLLCSHVLRLQLPCGQLLEVKYPEREGTKVKKESNPELKGHRPYGPFPKKQSLLIDQVLRVKAFRPALDKCKPSRLILWSSEAQWPINCSS